MKWNSLMALVLLSATPIFCQPLSSPLQITSFRDGVLAWTNQACAPFPVYQVLTASTVTGAWVNTLRTTNQSAITVTNSLGTAPGAVFHQLGWACTNDAPMKFDYAFDEGYGIPAVVGTFQIPSPIFFAASAPSAGTWHCEDFVCVDCIHPTGTANFASGFIDWRGPVHRVRLNFTPGSERVYLDGVMEIELVGGRPVYTGMHGDVYLSGFAGPDVIGTFTATRTP